MSSSLHICSQGIMLLGFPQYELELVHTGSQESIIKFSEVLQASC